MVLKKISILWFILWVSTISGICQTNLSFSKQTPKDSLPDLWIVTIDCSGSMRDMDFHIIPQKYDSIVTTNQINTAQDKVLVLTSGMSKDELWSADADSARRHNLTPFDNTFDRLLIKQKSDLLSYNQSVVLIKKLCSERRSFCYNWSFTSLVRPLTIYTLTSRKVVFLNYNNIYHVFITDDGDPNDQWSNDYKHLKKYRKSFEEVNNILPSVASSDFDFITKKTGKFTEITSDENQPRLYLTKYETYDEGNPETVYPIDSLLTVGEFHNDWFTLEFNNNLRSNIDFIYVDKYTINGHDIEVNEYIYPAAYILCNIEKNEALTLNNRITINGHYQETYNDRVLGKRHRTIPIIGELSKNYTSIETISLAKKCLTVLVILVLCLMAFIMIRRNLYVLNVYLCGKRYSIKKKAMNKLKYDDYNLVKIVCDKKNTQIYFYKDRGIYVVDNVKITDSANKELYIAIRGDFTNYNSHLLHDVMAIKKLLKVGKYRFSLLFLLGYKIHRFEYDDVADEETIGFEYLPGLLHTLTISINHSIEIHSFATNSLQETNLRMLACYQQQNADKIKSVRNNVMVNIMATTNTHNYKFNYAALNIFDTNSQHSANRIFLRYSLMCFFDISEGMTYNQVSAKLVEVAKHVLKREKQTIGTIEETPNFEDYDCKPSVTVDVSPMLSYIYLRTSQQSRMIYSPFTDGKINLANKQVEIYPRKYMELLNFPIRCKSVIHVNRIATTFDARSQRYETLQFLGNDLVVFNRTQLDFSYGHPEQCFDGTTYYAVDINELNELINNK